MGASAYKSTDYSDAPIADIYIKDSKAIYEKKSGLSYRLRKHVAAENAKRREIFHLKIRDADSAGTPDFDNIVRGYYGAEHGGNVLATIEEGNSDLVPNPDPCYDFAERAYNVNGDVSTIQEGTSDPGPN